MIQYIFVQLFQKHYILVKCTLSTLGNTVKTITGHCTFLLQMSQSDTYIVQSIDLYYMTGFKTYINIII